MADNIVGGLFGIMPEDLAAQRMAALDQQAQAFGRMSSGEAYKTLGYKAGNLLGQGLFGVNDPQMERARQRQQMSQGIDFNDPESLLQAAQRANEMGDSPAAQALYAKYQEVAQSQATLSKTQADARKVNLSIAQEEQLRQELAALGPDATEQQVLGVVSRFGSPDKILATLQGAQSRRDAAEARVEAAKVAAEATIERARMAGASAMQIKQMTLDAQAMLQSMRLDADREKSAAKAAEDKQKAEEKAANAVLPVGLQKDEGDDLRSIDISKAQITALKPVITALTPDEKTKARKLNLDPVNIGKYLIRNAAGQSTPESRLYADLKSTVDTVVNLQVSGEKGVQTDKDVVRFANALISAFGRNDSEATLEALKKYNDAVEAAIKSTQVRVDSRRSSQNVKSYFGQGTPTKRFNPATGNVEPITN